MFVVGDGECGAADEDDEQRTDQLGDDAAPEAQTPHVLLQASHLRATPRGARHRAGRRDERPRVTALPCPAAPSPIITSLRTSAHLHLLHRL